MVRRSLVLKIALYAGIVFVVAIPPATFVARRIVETGRADEVRARVEPQLGYIKREVEAHARGGRPDTKHLADLAAAFHGTLTFVPWGRPAIPGPLESSPWLIDEPPTHGPPTHWIKVEQDGRPIGALRLEPLHPRRPHRWFGAWRAKDDPRPSAPPPRRPLGPFAPHMVWIWVLLLMLAIVPPLYLWVLRPLRAMVGVAQRLGGGDLGTPVPLRHRDEFGELERAFEQLRVELKRALDQRERLLTDVSHEIRGPLSRIMLALPLLPKDPPDGPIKALLEGEVRAVDRLVGEVLSLARDGWGEALQRRPVALDALLHELSTERSLALEHQQVQLETDLAPVTVQGDARLLGRALGNLLDNALKYGGSRIHLSCEQVGGWAIARVADTGPGIAPEHLPNIFEPFYRPDDSRSRETGGTGLGLSIVRRIVERHGGTVTLTCPSPGETVAEVRLPTTAQAAVTW